MIAFLFGFHKEFLASVERFVIAIKSCSARIASYFCIRDAVYVIKHLLAWSIILMSFWLLLSGIWQSLLFVFATTSVLLVLFVIVRMDNVDKSSNAIVINLSFVFYVLWLLREIVFSSVDVARIIWSRKIKVEPVLAVLEFDPALKGGRVLFANSLTLTPGTLSVDLSENTITVHALDMKSIADLKEGEMQQRIIKLRN